MVVEDCSIVRSTICAILENDGMSRIKSSADLYDGIDLVEKEGPFDLVLLDYNMPGMDGLTGLRRMIEVNGNKPVAILSSGIPLDLAKEAVNSGASGYIPKYLSPQIIAKGIKSMSQGQKFLADYFLTQAA